MSTPWRASEPIVDWARTGRRLRTSGVVLAGIVAVGTGVTWLVAGEPSFGAWAFGGLAAMFLVELVVVGGSAVRGFVRAGERGARLARGDVSLLPASRRRVAAERTEGDE